ncbi:MAG: YdcF family protein [Aerococcus sp.]|nr:YdcF family protein [Aerococcus sp.]
MLYLIASALLLVALSMAFIAPRNLWDTWIASIGLLILSYAVGQSLYGPAHPFVTAFINTLDLIVRYIAPIFVLIVGILMIFSAFALYRSEENPLQLTLGLILAMLLMVTAMVTYYLLLFGNFFERYEWLHVSDYVLTYYGIILVNFLANTLRLWLFPNETRQDYVIVLGARIHPSGGLSTALRSRLDTTISYIARQRFFYQHVPYIIVSGAATTDGMALTEAQVMRDYLVANGIPQEKILMEEQAEDTHGNFYYAKQIMREREPQPQTVHAVFVTNTFHLYRSQIYSNMEHMYQISGIGAPISFRRWVVNGTREYVALLFMHRKFHLLMTFVLLFLGLSVYR